MQNIKNILILVCLFVTSAVCTSLSVIACDKTTTTIVDTAAGGAGGATLK